MKTVLKMMTILVLLPVILTVSAQSGETITEKKLFEYLSANPEYQRTKKGMERLRKSNVNTVGIATHRAANEFAPENTLSAMRCALDLQVDYIEMDVRQTKDGLSYLLHDGNLDRTTDGKGPINNKTSTEIRQLSAGKWFNPFFINERVPSLEEACQLLAAHNEKIGHKTYFYVDCKDINVAVLIDDLRRYNLLEGSVFYVSEKQIGQIRSLDPTAKMLPGLRSRNDLDRMIDTYHPYALDVNWEDLSKELIDRAHAKGVKIFSDGFGEAQTVANYQKAIQAGIDVISTNKVSVICDSIQLN